MPDTPNRGNEDMCKPPELKCVPKSKADALRDVIYFKEEDISDLIIRRLPAREVPSEAAAAKAGCIPLKADLTGVHVGAEVTHSVFGIGMICQFERRDTNSVYAHVLFRDAERIFAYPAAFRRETLKLKRSKG